ncbi:MAG: hypothetical protein Fur0025_17550 [Oscillatoriaceae cyanobacterium]
MLDLLNRGQDVPPGQIPALVTLLNAVTIVPGAMVREAVGVMSQAQTSAVWVVADAGATTSQKLIGVLTRGDVLRLLGAAGDGDWAKMTVGEVMTPEPIGLTKEEAADVELVAAKLRKAKISHLPVVDAVGGIVGMITPESLLRAERNRAFPENPVSSPSVEMGKQLWLYRTLAENFPNGAMLLFDQNFRYLLAEGKGLAEVGMEKRAIEGKTLWEAFDEEICTLVAPKYQAALAGEESTLEVPYQNGIYWLHILPVRDERRNIFGGMVLVQNITERMVAASALLDAKNYMERMVLQRNDELLLANAKLRQEIAERELAEAEKTKLIQSLQESEARYRAIVEDQTNLICRYLPDGTITFVNQAYCRYFGRSREEAMLAPRLGADASLTAGVSGSSFFPTIYDPDFHKVCDYINSLFSLTPTNPVATGEYRVVAQGQIRTVQWTERAIFDELGRIIEFQAIGQDVTERREAEALVRQTAERLQAALETVGEGITFSDGAGYFEIFNSKMEEITGYTKKEANRSGNFLALIYPDPHEYQNAISGIQEIILQGGCRNVETTICAKNGVIKTLLVSTSIVRYQQRNWLLSAYRDISERRRATVALAREKEHLAEAQKVAHVGSWELDWQQQKITWSEETFRIFGMEVQHNPLTWNEFLEKIYPDDRQLWTSHIRNCMEGKCGEFEFRIVRHLGFIRYLSCNQKPTFNSQGKIVGLFGTLLDITDRKQAEVALEQSKLLIQRIADTLPQVLYLQDIPTGRYLYVNRQIWEILGYTQEQVQQEPNFFLKAIHAVDAPGFRERLHNFAAISDIQGRRSHAGATPNGVREVVETEYRIRHADGSWRWFRSRDVVFTRGADGAPEQVVGTAWDISDRKEAAEALRQSQARLHAIVTNTSDGILLVDASPEPSGVRTGKVRFANPAAAKLFGRPVSELIGEDLGLPSLSDGGAVVELKINRSPTEVRVGEMCAVTTNWDGEPAYLVSLRDITERKQAEQLLKASLQEKEVLLKEIHHRVKNNMQVICSLLELQSQYIDDEQTVNLFQESQNRIQAMALIHEHLYQSPTLDRIDFADYLQYLVNNLFQSFGCGYRVRLLLNLEKLSLNIETATTCGLIVNELVSNSLKYAFPAGYDDHRAREGEIKIDFYQQEMSGAMVLAVADNGIGIPPELDIENTETLGLRLVVMLVRQLEGRLAVDRLNGTVFTIKFTELNYRRRI